MPDVILLWRCNVEHRHVYSKFTHWQNRHHQQWTWNIWELGSGQRYLICVTLFCTLCESKNTQTCENSTCLIGSYPLSGLHLDFSVNYLQVHAELFFSTSPEFTTVHHEYALQQLRLGICYGGTPWELVLLQPTNNSSRLIGSILENISAASLKWLSKHHIQDRFP